MNGPSVVSSHEVPAGFRPANMPAGFIEANGPLFWKDQDGYLIFGIRIEPRHTNAAGNLHGGMLMTFVDMQLNSALNYQLETGLFIPTVSVTVDFLNPAFVGEWIQGRTEILKRGGSTVFCECRIAKEDGTLIGRASGIFKLPRNGDPNALNPKDLFR